MLKKEIEIREKTLKSVDKIDGSIIELQTKLEELFIAGNKYIDLLMQLGDNMRNIWNEVILIEYD